MRNFKCITHPVITLRHDADLLESCADIAKRYRLTGLYHAMTLRWNVELKAWVLTFKLAGGEETYTIRYEEA